MKRPTGGGSPRGPEGTAYRALLGLLLFLQDPDLFDLRVVVVGDDQGADALRGDVGEELALDAPLNLIAGRLDRLGLLVELALDHLDLAGDRQGLLVALLLPLLLVEGDVLALDLGDDRPDLVGEDDADAEDEYHRGTKHFP